MLNVKNNANALKSELLSRVTKLELEGKLAEGIEAIPAEIVPDGKPIFRTVEQDREDIKRRLLADMGFSVEDYDEKKSLSDYAKEAEDREKPTWPVMTVAQSACNACQQPHFFPTDACQGCLARPCKVNCPKQAIEIVDRRAKIDQSKCIKCGLCAQNCPYGAIVKTQLPCETACPVGAISKDADGREKIDYDKCIFCGACMRECPFSVIMPKSQVVDVVRHIREGKKVVAMYAPAIGAQYRAKPGQLEGALEAFGFSHVWEVAIGADITADRESAEFVERHEEGAKLMTTSCCPAWVRAVQKHIPDLLPAVSTTRSPMHYNAELAKKDDPNCVTVFIGPCMAKRREGFDDDLVDYVLTVDEVDAMLKAKGINVATAEAKPGKYLTTVSGRNFAKTGGVAESVRIRLTPENQAKIKPLVINGLNKAAIKTLQNYGKIFKGEVEAPADCPNIIEVMACEGGCIAGPGIVTNAKMGNGLLTMYANAGSKPAENGIPVKCDMDAVIAGEKQ